MIPKQLLAGVLISVLGLTGCGGSSSEDATSSASQATTSDAAPNPNSSSSTSSLTKLPDDPSGLKVVYKENWVSENSVLSKYEITCQTGKGASLIRIHNTKTGDTRYSIEKPDIDFASLVGSESGDEGLISDDEFEENVQKSGLKIYSTAETAVRGECRSSNSNVASSALSPDYAEIDVGRCHSAMAIFTSALGQSLDHVSGQDQIKQANFMMEVGNVALTLRKHMEAVNRGADIEEIIRPYDRFVTAYGVEKYVRDNIDRCFAISKHFPQQKAF